MKRHYLLGLFLLVSVLTMAQKPVAKFTETNFDFGTFKEQVGKVSHTFEFTNTGNAPLILTNVQASCGCTTPEWSKKPVAPGQKGKVVVTYNAKGRPGPFTKTITVTNNSDESKILLNIKGEVEPKNAPKE